MFIGPSEQARLERALDACLRHLRNVRKERPEWYAWVTEGQPTLTTEQYEKVGKKRPTQRASGR